MKDKDTTEKVNSKDYYQQNREKYRAKSLEYYHRNKERINGAKRKTEVKDIPPPVITSFDRTNPTQPKLEVTVEHNYTLADIAKLLLATGNKIKVVMGNPKYLMPKPLYKRVDGTDIYDRKEIDGWLPYIASVVAFTGKGKKIKITGNALHIVKFMHANKKVIEHCDAIRRAKGEVYG